MLPFRPGQQGEKAGREMRTRVVDLGTILMNFLMFAQVQRFKECVEICRNFKVIHAKAEQSRFIQAITTVAQPLEIAQKTSDQQLIENQMENNLASGQTCQATCMQPIAFSNSKKIKFKASTYMDGTYKSTVYLKVGAIPKNYQSTMFIIPREFQCMSEIEFFIGEGKRPERFAIMLDDPGY